MGAALVQAHLDADPGYLVSLPRPSFFTVYLYEVADTSLIKYLEQCGLWSSRLGTLPLIEEVGWRLTNGEDSDMSTVAGYLTPVGQVEMGRKSCTSTRTVESAPNLAVEL